MILVILHISTTLILLLSLNHEVVNGKTINIFDQHACPPPIILDADNVIQKLTKYNINTKRSLSLV